MKTRTKLTTLVFSMIMALVFCIGLIPMFSMTASAAAADQDIVIDTGETITLKDSDGNDYYEIYTADDLYAFASAIHEDRRIKGEIMNDIDINPGYTFTFDADTGLVEIKKDGSAVVYFGTGAVGDTSGANTTFDITASIAGKAYADKQGAEYTGEHGLRSWVYWEEAAYGGALEGNNKTVSGLFDVNTVADNGFYNGLIGGALNFTIKNLTLDSGYIYGEFSVGGIIGRFSGTMENCHNKAIVVGVRRQKIAGVGGVVGEISDDATVDNCSNSGTVIGNYGVAGVIGEAAGFSNFKITLTNLSNTGYVNGVKSVGGIIGVHGYYSRSTCTLRSSWNSGTVVGQTMVGGVVGELETYGDIYSCYNMGSIIGSDTYIGGVVGHTDGSVYNVYNIGAVTNGYALHGNNNKYISGGAYYLEGSGNAQSGYVAFTQDDLTSGKVTYLLNQAYESSAFTQNIDNGETPEPRPVYNSAKVYYGYISCAYDAMMKYTNDSTASAEKPHSYDETGICTKVEGQTHYQPATKITEENRESHGFTDNTYIGYYAITNAGNLYWFADKVDNENATYGSANVVLTDNITVNSGTVTASSTGMRVWNPIGYYDVTSKNNAGITGTFDGNGKTVSGLYFNNPLEDDANSCIGLIGYVAAGGTVKNVTVSNSYILGYMYTSGIVGWNNGTVTGCVNNATISGEGQQGGIVGRNYGTVELCGNTGTLTNTWSYSGGIAASNYGIVRNCWNTGSISAEYNAGGIVGEQVMNTARNSLTENCWSTGTVAGDDSGNIAGYLYGVVTVRNCYSTGGTMVGSTSTSQGTPVTTNLQWKSTAAFASGEVAYRLQSGVAEVDGTTPEIWGQTIGNETYPVLGGAKVYYGYTSCAVDAVQHYTNNSNASNAPIEHVWSYKAEGNTITATCGNSCGTDGGSIKITANDSTYTPGTPNAAKLTDADDNDAVIIGGLTELPTIQYEKKSGEGWETATTTAPTDAGTYKASITVDTDKTVSVEFTIEKATPTASDFDFAAPTDPTYDGNGKTATVTAKDDVDGMGEVTVTYYDADGALVPAPTNVGTYTVKINVAEGDNCEAITDLQIDTFEILPKNIGTVSLDDVDLEYNGSEQKPTVAEIEVDGMTLVEGTDYTLSFDGDDYVGAGTKIITVEGNCEGTLTYEIAQKPLLGSDISIDITEETYNGEEHTPTITVKDGEKTLTYDTDYKIDWDKDGFVDAGTYTATITGDGNYSGTFTRKLVINQAALVVELTSPITSVLPGNQIALTLNANTDATPVWEITGGLHVSDTTVKIADGLTIGKDTVTITVTYDATDNYEGGSESITLDVGMADFSGAIAELEADIAELNELIAEGGDIDQINAKLTEITGKIATLEANGATDAEVEAAITAAKTELSGTISALETKLGEEVTKLQNQINSNDTDITTINSTIDAIKAILGAIPEDTDIATELNKLAQALSALTNRVGANEGNISANASDIEALQTALAGLGDALDEIESDSLADALTDLDDAIDTLNDELSALEERVKANEQAIKDLEDLVEQLRTDVDNNDTDITTINSTIDAIKDILGAIPENTDIATELNKLAQALSALTNRVGANEGNISANASDIAALQTALAGLGDALDEIESDTLADALTDLDDAIDTLNDKLSALAKRVEDNEKAIADIKQKLDTAIEDLKNADGELQGAIDTNSGDIAGLTQELADKYAELKALVGTLPEGVESMKAYVDGINTALTSADATMQEAIKQLRIDMEAADGKLQGAINTNSGNIAGLTQELADKYAELKALVGTLPEGVESMKAYVDGINTALTKADATMQEAIDKVAADLAKAQEDLNKAIADGDDALDEKIEALNDALDAAKVALEKANADNKAELVKKIDDADATLDAAIKAVQKDLDDLKAALEAKDSELESKTNELQIFIIIVCAISGVALCGSGAFVIWFFVDRKKRIK